MSIVRALPGQRMSKSPCVLSVPVAIGGVFDWAAVGQLRPACPDERSAGEAGRSPA